MTTDFTSARQAMVDCQIRPSDVTDRALISVLRAMPREHFAPAGMGGLAYAEMALEVAPERRLLAPRDVAKLIQALTPAPGQRALEIAGATGYGAAVLAALGARTSLLEPDAALVAMARAALEKAGYGDVDVVSTDLREGWPEGAPYDVILVNGAVEVVPEAWLAQLAEGGRMGVIVRSGAASSARVYTRHRGASSYAVAFQANAPVIAGLEAPKEFQF